MRSKHTSRKKRLERKERLERRRDYNEKRPPKRPRQSTTFKIAEFRVIKTKECDDTFFKLICKAVKTLEQEVLNGDMPYLYEYLDQIGLLYASKSGVFGMSPATRRGYESSRKEVENQSHSRRLNKAIGLRLPPRIINYCGDCTFWVEVSQCILANTIDIYCKTLHKKSTPKGTRYYSDSKVEINRVPMQLMFSQHSKDRIVQRCQAHMGSTYSALCVAGGIMSADYTDGIKYRETKINNDYALELFIQGGSHLIDRHGKVYMKLAYLPCHIEGNKAHIPTVLIPGMKQTTESRALKRLPRDFRKKVIDDLSEGVDLTTMVWLWLQGENMIVDSQFDPIAPSEGKRRVTDPKELYDILKEWGPSKLHECIEELFK